MQELIEKCGYSTTFDGKYMIVLSQQEVQELLKKEKKQIIEAYLTGADYTNDEEVILANEYYNQTYNQNK